MAISFNRQSGAKQANLYYNTRKSKSAKSAKNKRAAIKKPKLYTPASKNKSSGGSAIANPANQMIQNIFQQLQSSISNPFQGLQGWQGLTGTSSIANLRVNVGVTNRTLTAEQIAPEPEQWQVDMAVRDAGGMEALSPWLVDGKTKLTIDGRKSVVQVSDSTGQTGSAREQAAAAIARFGFSADRLDGDLEQLKKDLNSAAASASSENPNIASAVEYALEDAYAKIHTLGNGDTASAGGDYEAQSKKNKEQADSIARQLNMGENDAWGIYSLGEDLAVFGMDFTAMAGDHRQLAAQIKEKSKEMLADLDSRYVGTEAEYMRERNRITGASARLVNGLEGGGSAAALFSSNINVSASVNVTVGGVSLNASSLVAVSSVVVDPLVLDLNGDGIDLKSAEDGVEFDMNGDGEKTQMGFIKGDDALLFIDEYGDGVVRDGRQLFGNTDGHANGFEKLAAYDDNGDGVIDENDAIYDKLMVWVEKTEDGVCDSSETMSLREAGVKSIAVGYENTREDDGKGNLTGQVGSFTREDGSQGTAADMWFQELAAKAGYPTRPE